MKKLLLVLAIIALLPCVAQAALLNLSGATATASTQYLSYVAANAIDANPSTMWNAGIHATSASPAWLKVDLGALYDVDSIALKSKDTSYSKAYYITFDLYYATTPDVWQLAGSGTLYDDPITYINSINLGGQQAQYLKFEVDGGTHWAHLAEMEVYGQASTSNGNGGQAPVPEPASMILFGVGLVGLMRFRK
jgi:hypothetical protein